VVIRDCFKGPIVMSDPPQPQVNTGSDQLASGANDHEATSSMRGSCGREIVLTGAIYKEYIDI
jgi:hypothetical protein